MKTMNSTALCRNTKGGKWCYRTKTGRAGDWVSTTTWCSNGRQKVLRKQTRKALAFSFAINSRCLFNALCIVRPETSRQTTTKIFHLHSQGSIWVVFRSIWYVRRLPTFAEYLNAFLYGNAKSRKRIKWEMCFHFVVGREWKRNMFFSFDFLRFGTYHRVENTFDFHINLLWNHHFTKMSGT